MRYHCGPPESYRSRVLSRARRASGPGTGCPQRPPWHHGPLASPRPRTRNRYRPRRTDLVRAPRGHGAVDCRTRPPRTVRQTDGGQSFLTAPGHPARLRGRRTTPGGRVSDSLGRDPAAG
ncbi:hypothetical protein SGM_5886 [Streptomyces griseoaurantiacus M045]|uniref:Uncharacterized protein n=1 Tax=Streptomyces griseoaurantiacus M045 TaxID=996637 RepID=F3NRX2_9ACTN|nr:hypothetical protein SGM_5886 [Streptomyces griseoaurantiacus M045]